MTLADAYKILQAGTLWSSTGKCRGYAIANPGEAAKIDAYIADLNAGRVVTPPSLVTDTGRGIVGMLAALTATPSPTPGGGYSPDRFVYALGDPAWAYGGSPYPGWWGGGKASGEGDASSSGWGRNHCDGSLTHSRIAFDDTVDVMRSVVGSDGKPGVVGPCHTVAATVLPTDPLTPGIASGAQNATLSLYPDKIRADNFWGVFPSFSPKQGETWWYGYAFRSNSAYVPHGLITPDLVYGNFNGCGLEFHISDPAVNVNGALGPLGMLVATIVGTSIVPSAAGYYYVAPTGMKSLVAPRLELDLGGGDVNAGPNVDNATNTCRRYQGPLFVAGRLYKVIYKIHWDAFKQGSIDWWVDSGDGQGYVHWASDAGVSTMWRNGQTVDTSMYPQLQNYRKYDASLPAATFYYGGFIRGSTQADVAVP